MVTPLPAPLVGNHPARGVLHAAGGYSPAAFSQPDPTTAVSIITEWDDFFVPSLGCIPTKPDGDVSRLFHELLQFAQQYNASDLDLQPGLSPFIHTSAGLLPCNDFPIFRQSHVLDCIAESLAWRNGRRVPDTHPAWERLRSTVEQSLLHQKTAEFSCDPLTFRLRAHLALSQNGLGVTFRFCPVEPPNLDQLGLPQSVTQSILGYITRHTGFGLVVGPTGSGKSTTLASLVHYLRCHYRKKIITVEDPIEYSYDANPNYPGRVLQKELGTHVTSFSQALESSLRERPDLIVMQELRDTPSASACLHATQTGHLILATLHTSSTASALRRIVELVPGVSDETVLRSCSESILFILTQRLVEKAGGGRQLVIEFFQNRDLASRTAIASFHRDPQLLRDNLAKPHNAEWNSYVRNIRQTGLISDETARELFVSDTRMDRPSH